MQDDCYLIAADGWKAKTSRIIETDKKGKERDKGWTCDLIPKRLIVARYYAKEQASIDALVAELGVVTARLAELEEENGGEDGAFAELDQVTKANVALRLKYLQAEQRPEVRRPRVPAMSDVAIVAEAPAPYSDEATSEADVLVMWLKLSDQDTELKKRLKDAEADLDAKAYAYYPKLTEGEVKVLVVDDKWLAALDAAVHGEMDRVSQQLTHRVRELAERYEAPLPRIASRVAELEAKVARHLQTMGFPCK